MKINPHQYYHQHHIFADSLEILYETENIDYAIADHVFAMTSIIFSYASLSYTYQSFHFFTEGDVLKLNFDKEKITQVSNWYNYIHDNQFQCIYYPNNGTEITFAEIDELNDLLQDSPELIQDDNDTVKVNALAMEDTWSDHYFYQNKQNFIYNATFAIYDLHFNAVLDRDTLWVKRSSNPIVPLIYNTSIQGEWLINIHNEADIAAIQLFLDQSGFAYRSEHVESMSVPQYMIYFIIKDQTASMYRQLYILAVISLVFEFISRLRVNQSRNLINQLVGGTKRKDFIYAIRSLTIDYLTALFIILIPISTLFLLNRERYHYMNSLFAFQITALFSITIAIYLIFTIIYLKIPYLPENRRTHEGRRFPEGRRA